MQKNTKLRVGVVAAFAAAALAIGTVAPAYAADPTIPKTLNGAGSDTTQDVMAGVASVVTSLGNWDAFGSENITIGSTTFARPIGSTAGVRALSSSVRGIGYPNAAGVVLPVGTLQFARSSALRTESGSQLTYIPFARDAVSIAMSASSDFPKDVALGVAGQPTNAFTLRNIYLGTVTSFTDSEGATITIRPKLPQVNSGTRVFWVTEALGTTDALIGAGGAVTDQGINAAGVLGPIQEHDGSFLRTDGDIVPFSVAQFLAQGNYRSLPTAVVERRGNIILGSIDTVDPISYDGVTVATNPSFLPSRLVYNVVETRALTTLTPSADDLAVRAAFVGTGAGSVCAASAQIKAYGFATLPASQCGATNLQRGYVN